MEGKKQNTKQVSCGKRRSLIRTICHVMAVVMLLAMIPVIAPQRAQAAPTESSDFLMHFISARNLPGRGTLVSGTIEKGSVNTGDKVVIAYSTAAGAPWSNSVTVKGIEKNKQTVDSAKAGDSVNLLIKEIDPGLLKDGDALISDDNSPYVNHRGMISGSLTPVSSTRNFKKNETVTLQNSYVTLTAELVEKVEAYSINGINVEVYFRNPDHAHVYYLGEEFNVIVGSRVVARLTVNKIASSGAYTIVANEYDRTVQGGLPVDFSDFTSPYPNYTWVAAEEDGYVCAKSYNQNKTNTSSTLTYKKYFSKETTVSFSYKIWAEGSGSFIVDGKTKFSDSYKYDNWEEVEYVLSPGSHTLTWEYIRDSRYDTSADDYLAVRNLIFYESNKYTLDANGGYFTGVGTKVTEYVDHKNANYLSAGPIPVKTGYTFRYYSCTPGHPEVREDVVKWSSDSGVRNYYAVWEKNDENMYQNLDFRSTDGWKFIDADDDHFVWHYYEGERNWFSSEGVRSDRIESFGWYEITGPDPEWSYTEHCRIDADDWAVSPAVKLGDMKYTLRFRAMNTDSLSVYVGISPVPAAMKKVADYRGHDVDEMTEFTVPLDGYENKTVYIAFRHYPDFTYEEHLYIEHPRVVEEFSDVRAGSNNGQDTYFYEPVYWAKANEITMGVMGKDGVYRTFNPTGDCTRAQMVTFLWRMADCPEPTKLTNYPDVDKNSYYYKAVCWAQEKGITEGYPDGTFKPQNPCDRKQAVTFLWRFADKPKVSKQSNFTDVEPGTYYYDAVNWAAYYEITTGYSDGTFRPTNKCTRSQMVTFLYRYNNIPKG